MKDLKKYYSMFPYPFKCLLATIYGCRLNSWRYGKETERLVDEALEREYWDRERIKSYQMKQLELILNRAVTEVPYYKKKYSGMVMDSSGNNIISIAQFEPVTKKIIRENSKELLSESIPIRSLYHIHTSGSTGTPLNIYWSKAACRKWYALFEARWRRWNGLSRFDRWAIIGGQPVVAIDKRTPPFWVWNMAMRQLYISAYHLAPWSAKSIIESMKKHKISYIWGYASAIEALAKLVLDQNLNPPELKAVISNAEPLLDRQRKIMNDAFGTKVINTYGMAEIVAGASECEYGRMHIWEDAGIIEILGESCSHMDSGLKGSMLCTGLINDAMPLIRYEVGDRGALEDESLQCPCGRNFRMMKSIEGRLDDVVITPDGRHVGRLDTVFKNDFPILKAQIIQEEIDLIVIKIEPAAEYSEDAAQQIREAVLEKVGSSMRVLIENVDSIPLSANGKFRGVINKVR
jgi:phenylacetate-CoA ligase